jgi:hypothetical protein
MKNLLFIFTFLILLSACGGQNIQNSGYEKTSSVQSTPKELSFIEDSSFDEALSKAMRSGKVVTVTLPTSVEPELGEMPQQLDQWLAFIKENGGDVHYEPLNSDMGFGDWFMKLLPWTVKELFPYGEPKYKPAKNYNARLCYQRDDNLVTRIVFVGRNHSDQPVCLEK